jgi:hypothetical protein
MKYKKGTFTTVPNKDVLRGLDPQTQVLFVWLCSYADEEGVCFPSISRLASDCGMTGRSVINKLRVLEEKGLVERTRRKKENSNENAVNEYQIIIVEGSERGSRGSEPASPRSERGSLGGSERDSQELKPYTNSNQGTQKAGQSPARKKATYNPLGVEIIRAFEAVDPKNKLYYQNTTQRAACDFLLEEYGLEEVLKRIIVLPKTNKARHFPTITTPCQLRDKWVSLQDAVERKRSEFISKQSNVAFS